MSSNKRHVVDPRAEPFARLLAAPVSHREELGSKGPPRWCRFCERFAPEVTFKKEAHVLPSALGNRSLFSLEECDECNWRGSKLETDLAGFLSLARVTSMVPPGRGGPIKHKPWSGIDRWMEAMPNDRRLTVRVGAGGDDDGPVRVTLHRDGMRLSTLVPSYRPANVARALARMLLFVVPREELPALHHILQWVRGADLWRYPRYHVARMPGTLPAAGLTLHRPGPGMPSYCVNLYFGHVALSCFLPDASFEGPMLEFPASEPVDTYEYPADFVVRSEWVSVDVVPGGFVRASDEEIAVAAYYRWLEGGRRDGTALDDWLWSQEEVTRRKLVAGQAEFRRRSAEAPQEDG